jgi:CubicO group peptidase (beta-lactamase class C family)
MTFSSPLLIGFALIFCSVATSHVFARDPTAQRSEQVFRPLIGPSSPGLSVIVLKEGKTVFEGSYGLANLEIRTPISPLTNFRLASFTKQFTAMCIMLLVHDAKLSYDDTLTKIFPDFPAYGSAITVRMMLTHTAGLKDYEDTYSAQFPGADDRKIPQIKQTSTDFPPGAISTTAIPAMRC